MTVKRIRFVTFRFDHHSGHSGYDRVSEFAYSGYETSVINAPKLVDFSGYSRHGKRQRHLIMRDIALRISYRSIEAKTAASIIRDSIIIYHVLYGEQTFKHLGRLVGFRQNKVVATYHLPPSQITVDSKMVARLKKLSAIICVGSNQLDLFSSIAGKDRVFYVPHGVDVEYFCPPEDEMERDPDLCLCVGNLYRDFPTYRGVVELVASYRPQTKFVLVTQPMNEIYVGRHPNLEIRSGIPESELLQLYQKSSLFVSPFKDGTANNAILEAMACGLPIVSTDIGAMRDYVNEGSACLLPLYDSQGMAKKVIDLLGDADARRAMSRAARNRALDFSWPKVSKLLGKVYDQVFE